MMFDLKLEGVKIGQYPSKEEAERAIEIELSLSSLVKLEDYSIEHSRCAVGTLFEVEPKQMEIEDFGRALLETGDLDPIYIILHRANRGRNR